MVKGFSQRGWAALPYSDAVKAWAAEAHRVGVQEIENPAHAHWWQCEGTWFVGVDALPNDAQGRVGQGAALSGPPVEAVTQLCGAMPDLHPAQLSVLRPGYPRPREGESAAGFRYRRNRDAAHVDGLRLFGPNRERRLEEPHAFILGLPLNQVSPDASPLVVWEGSHRIMGPALARALQAFPDSHWPEVDLAGPYQAARRQVFETCRRIELVGRPGESWLLHRHILHGIAPWVANATAPDTGRMVAYFRPMMPGGIAAWLVSP